MNYIGELYGRVGRKYVKLIYTTEDVDRIEAENKKLRKGLSWTTERPTEPGWYWVRGKGYPESIVEYERHKDGRLFCAWDFPIFCEPYEWAGPIHSPNSAISETQSRITKDKA